jgi:hypothetical protein
MISSRIPSSFPNSWLIIEVDCMLDCNHGSAFHGEKFGGLKEMFLER